MIRSIPNPPMGRDDVARFRKNLEKYLRGEFTAEEKRDIQLQNARAKHAAERIIANSGGKNPILGY